MALKFIEAIEEVDDAAADAGVDHDVLVKYLREHAPDIADLVIKDMTVSDVHQTTALGNEKDRRRKPRSFKDKITTMTDRPKPDAVVDPVDASDEVGKHENDPDGEFDPETATFDSDGSSDRSFRWWLSQLEKQGKTRTVIMIRHGATHLNNDDVSVDRIRGWKDVPLSKEGEEEAHKLAKKIAKDPPDVVVCSDLKRAHDTAKVIADACGMSIAQVSKAFRPWDVGKFAGEKSKIAVPILQRFACSKPDQALPGGESFNDFRKRFLTGLADALDEHPGVVAVVAHHRNERLIEAWAAAGFKPDGTIDAKVFGKKGEHTGSAEEIEIPVDKLRSAARSPVTKWIGKSVAFLDEDSDDDAGGDWDIPFKIVKAEPDKQMVFGWASIATENGRPIIDKQGDVIDPGDLEMAAYDFVLYSRTQGDMHDKKDVGRMIESMVFTAEKQEALGINLGLEGWWVGFLVDNPATWREIKAGRLPEFSIGGRGERVAI